MWQPRHFWNSVYGVHAGYLLPVLWGVSAALPASRAALATAALAAIAVAPAARAIPTSTVARPTLAFAAGAKPATA